MFVAVLVSVVLMAGTIASVSAQSAGVTATMTPGTPVVSAGSGVWLGNIQISNAGSNSAQVSSVPITIAAGYSASSLSGCRIYNQSFTQLNTGANVLNNVTSGTNTIVFDNALIVPGNSSVSLSLRCDVGSNATATSTTVFAVGTPNVITSGQSATTSPGSATTTTLAINMSTASSVRPGTQDAALGIFTLKAGGQGSVDVTSVPISATFGNGLDGSHFSDCRIRNLSSLTTALNANGSGALAAGQNSFTLDSALSVNSGNTATLVLTCDISSLAPIGGSLNLAVNPGGFPATVSGSSTTVTPKTGLNVNNQPGSISGTTNISSSASAPGLPNTGVGGFDWLTTSGNPTLWLMALIGLLVLAAVFTGATRRS